MGEGRDGVRICLSRKYDISGRNFSTSIFGRLGQTRLFASVGHPKNINIFRTLPFFAIISLLVNSDYRISQQIWESLVFGINLLNLFIFYNNFCKA